MANYQPTERNRIARLPKRAVYDQAQIHAILDEGFLCHVGFTVDQQPYVIPTGYVRVGEKIYLHGSAPLVLALPLEEVSAKIRTGPPLDEEEDYALPVWAGFIPLHLRAGDPIPDPRLFSLCSCLSYQQTDKIPLAEAPLMDAPGPLQPRPPQPSSPYVLESNLWRNIERNRSLPSTGDALLHDQAVTTVPSIPNRQTSSTMPKSSAGGGWSKLS